MERDPFSQTRSLFRTARILGLVLTVLGFAGVLYVCLGAGRLPW